MTYKLITFDAFHTLFRPRSIGSTYLLIAQRYGLANDSLFNREAIEREFPSALRWTKQRYPCQMDGNRRMSNEEWWKHIIWRTFIQSNILTSKVEILKENLPDITRTLVQAYSNGDAFECIENIPEILKSLGNINIVIGSITNSDERVREILKGLNILEYLDFVITSESVGFEKPDKRIWEASWVEYQNFKGEKLNSNQHIHIGDDIEADYYGSRNLGITSILYDPKQIQSEKKDQNVYSISSFKEMIPVTEFFTKINKINNV